MRTTLILDDELVREAKHRAVSLNITLSELINRALRDTLRPRPGPAEPPFRMTTYGPVEPVVDHEPADFYIALEDDDARAL